mgnify:CR=1 FL=1
MLIFVLSAYICTKCLYLNLVLILYLVLIFVLSKLEGREIDFDRPGVAPPPVLGALFGVVS